MTLDPSNARLLDSYGWSLWESGRPEEALVIQRKAAALDPLNWDYQYSIGFTLALMKRSREAREAQDRALALGPTQLDPMSEKVVTFVQEGDLAHAREAVDTFSKVVDETRLVALLANDEFSWVLNPAQRDLLLRLTPTEFGDNRAAWARALANECWLRGDAAKAKQYADEAQREYARQIQQAPDNALLHIRRATTLAILGNGDEALREAAEAVRLTPPIDARNRRYVLFGLSKVHVRLGNQDAAIDALTRLLQGNFRLTPGWLRIDPNYDRLRNNPRFAALQRG